MIALVHRLLHPLWIVEINAIRGNRLRRLPRLSWGNLFYQEGKEIPMTGSILTPIDPDIALLEAVVYAKDQPQYNPLPVRKSADGEVVSCWKPNWRARLAILFGGNFNLTMVTFNLPLQPIRVSVDKPEYRVVEP